MLSAVLHGKKTGTGFAGLSLKLGEMQGAEDVLTSTIFERIAYLPDEIFCLFINSLLGNTENISSLVDINFWYALEDHKGKRVEPDVLLTDSNGRVIIVEAKRYDYAQQQYPYQLANEIIALHCSKESIENPIILAIGGMASYDEHSCLRLRSHIDEVLQEKGFNLPYQLYICSWQTLYFHLKTAIHSHLSAGLVRLLQDIKAVYHWHGIRYEPRRWLNQLNVTHIQYSEIPLKIVKKRTWTPLNRINLHYEKVPSFLGEDYGRK